MTLLKIANCTEVFFYSKISIKEQMLNVFLLSHRLNDSLVSKKPRSQKAEDIVVTHIIRDRNDIKNTNVSK